MKPTFFRTPPEFRAWLEKRHREARELWVGFHKKSSGQASIMWPEAVDEALCFGWIDGQRKGIDEVDHAIRFTPRKPGTSGASRMSSASRNSAHNGACSRPASRRSRPVRKIDLESTRTNNAKPRSLTRCN